MLGSLLSHTCTIERRAAGLNAIGEDSGAWETSSSNVACYLVEKAQAIWVIESAAQLGVKSISLILPAGTDIIVGDRINSVDLGDGSSRGPFIVDSILSRVRPAGLGAHHLTIALKELE